MLLSPADVGAVFLRVGFVDLRKGVLGLSALIDREFVKDGRKALFVFTNRARSRLRILYWDDTGFAYWHKALEQERFKWPKSTDVEVELSWQELRWLLSGVDITRIKTHQPTNPKAIF
jgi:transposase